MKNFIFLIIICLIPLVASSEEIYIDGYAAQTTEVQEFDGLSAAPSVSPANKARLYFDSIADRLKLSENAGAYSNLLTGATGLLLDCSNDPLTESLEMTKAIDNIHLYMTVYSTNNARYPRLYFQKSASNTLGTMVTTSDDEWLGNIKYLGVNNVGAFAGGGQMTVQQDGVAGAYVPTEMKWTTYSAVGENANQVVLDNTGYTGFGTDAPVTRVQVIGTATVDGLTLDADELITIGGKTITFDSILTDFVFNDDGIFKDINPGIYIWNTENDIAFGWHYHMGATHPIGFWRLDDGDVNPGVPLLGFKETTYNAYFVGDVYVDGQTCGFRDNGLGDLEFTEDGGATWTDVGSGGGGDAVTVNAGAVDTTANIADGGDLDWTLTDGGAGGPDDITAVIKNDVIDTSNFAHNTDFGDFTTDGAGTIRFDADSIDNTHMNWPQFDYLDEEGAVDIAAYAAVGAFASGDTFLVLEAGVGIREADYDDLPGAATAYDDIGDPDAAGSISFGDGETATYTTVQDSAANFFNIINTNADVSNLVTLLRLQYTDNGQDLAHFLTCNDNAGDVKFFIQEEGKVEITPGGVGSANIFRITPSAVISTNEAIWNAISINGAALDPSGNDVFLCGLGIDFSGVAPTGTGEDIDGIQIKMASGEEHAVHIEEGKVVIDNTAGAAAGAEYTVVDIRLNTSSLHANSDMHAIDVAVEAGTPAGKVVAVGTHSNVDPIAQGIGVFSTPNQDEFAGKKKTGGTVWVDGDTPAIAEDLDGNEMFVVDDDEIYVGSAAVFNEIEVDMGTVATKSVTPTFWYSSAGPWTQFFPADDTDGFQQDGTIRWTLDDISGSWTNDGDPGGADSTAGYWIKIVRTANADPGTPTPTTVKTGVITNYFWDKTGAIDVLSVEADTLTEGGNAVYNSTEIEAAVEPLIDTLANLTSIQGLTVGFADAGAVDAFWGWDDTASTYENLTAAEALAIIGGAATDFDGSGAVAWGNITAGELADDTVNDDDINWGDIAGLVADGYVASGAAVADPNAAGELAVDTTTDQFLYYGGAQRVITYFYERGFVLEDPAVADDDVPFWHPKQNITITDVYGETQGGTSCTIAIGDGTNELEAIVFDADGQADDGSIANASFVANERMEFDVDAVVGSVDWVAVTITYTIDAD